MGWLGDFGESPKRWKFGLGWVFEGNSIVGYLNRSYLWRGGIRGNRQIEKVAAIIHINCER